MQKPKQNVQIVAAMADRGLAGNDLAKLAGINPASLSRIIHRHQTPHPTTQGKIARALGLPVIELFHGGHQ